MCGPRVGGIEWMPVTGRWPGGIKAPPKDHLDQQLHVKAGVKAFRGIQWLEGIPKFTSTRSLDFRHLVTSRDT